MGEYVSSLTSSGISTTGGDAPEPIITGLQFEPAVPLPPCPPLPPAPCAGSAVTTVPPPAWIVTVALFLSPAGAAASFFLVASAST